jgi:hypothetical protein
MLQHPRHIMGDCRSNSTSNCCLHLLSSTNCDAHCQLTGNNLRHELLTSALDTPIDAHIIYTHAAQHRHGSRAAPREALLPYIDHPPETTHGQPWPRSEFSNSTKQGAGQDTLMQAAIALVAQPPRSPRQTHELTSDKTRNLHASECFGISFNRH